MAFYHNVMDEFLTLEECKIIHFLLNVIDESVTVPIYIHGPEKCGKSHLLHSFYQNKARLKEFVMMRSGESLSDVLDFMSLRIKKARIKELMALEGSEKVEEQENGWLLLDDIDEFDFGKSRLVNTELAKMIKRNHTIITSKKYPHELDSDVVRDALKDAVVFEMREIGEKSRYRILEQYVSDRCIWIDPIALYTLAGYSMDIDVMKEVLDKVKEYNIRCAEPLKPEDLTAFL